MQHMGFSNWDLGVAILTSTNNCADYDMVRAAHNNYAYYQKQNPHTPNVLKSLGLNEEDVNLFVKESLFPEI